MARGTPMTPNEKLIVTSLEEKLEHQRSELHSLLSTLGERKDSYRMWNLPADASIEQITAKIISNLEQWVKDIEQTKALIGNIKQGVVMLQSPTPAPDPLAGVGG